MDNAVALSDDELDEKRAERLRKGCFSLLYPIRCHFAQHRHLDLDEALKGLGPEGCPLTIRSDTSPFEGLQFIIYYFLT